MKIKDIVELLNARVIVGQDQLDSEVGMAFSSELMSDVLTVETENLMLITGLANVQTIRTAEMSDILQILFVRNKQPTKTMIDLAIEHEITIITTPYSMFRASGLLFNHGLKPVY